MVSGVTICFDRQSASKADGLSVSWVETGDGGAFRIDNPNEPARVKPIAATELKKWIDSGKTFELFDVRPEEERAIAKLNRARALDAAGEKALAALAKDTPVVLMCHHGSRSRNAAERVLRDGFTQVFNLEGGIDAWSQQIDTKVPRY